eukprot:s498_g21.t1
MEAVLSQKQRTFAIWSCHTAPSALINLIMSELSSEEAAALAKIQAAAKGADVRMAAVTGESQAGKEAEAAEAAEMSPEEKEALLKIQAAQRGQAPRGSHDDAKETAAAPETAFSSNVSLDVRFQGEEAGVPFLTLVGPVSTQRRSPRVRAAASGAGSTMHADASEAKNAEQPSQIVDCRWIPKVSGIAV